MVVVLDRERRKAPLPHVSVNAGRAPRVNSFSARKNDLTPIVFSQAEAAAMVEAWKQGETTRSIIDRGSGKVIGKITADGNRVISYHHTDKGTPQMHWNLEDKTTGGNIHLVIE